MKLINQYLKDKYPEGYLLYNYNNEKNNISLFLCKTLNAQQLKTQNLIIVTLDGYRWQEVFKGVDTSLIDNEKFVSDSRKLRQRFWADTEDKRRERLMPFFWSELSQKGRIYGNREYGNFVNVSNLVLKSYPGYSEIFTGYPDPLILDNKRPDNLNINVLEYLNLQQRYKGQVAAPGVDNCLGSENKPFNLRNITGNRHFITRQNACK